MSTQKLHELDRRVAALELGAPLEGEAPGRPPTLSRADVADALGIDFRALFDRLEAVERGGAEMARRLGVMDEAAPGLAAQVGEKLAWLKQHADETDEAGKMVLDRLDEIVGRLGEVEKRLAALEAKKGKTNG